ncbi:MAG: hypothetical protein ACRES7_05595 [Gammaproteobacteria bacterium]
MKFVNKKFTEDVSIDYNEFVDCEFENCRLLFHGGTFTLTRAKLKNVRFGVADAANHTLLFLRFMRDVSPQSLEELLNNVGGTTKPQSNALN